MGSADNPDWFIDTLIDEIPVAEGDFAAATGDFYWNPPGFSPAPNVSGDVDSLLINSDGPKEPRFGKRARSESSSAPASKAGREKLRRDRLNDRFLELASLLDPGKPPKMDKAAILSDAARLMVQLREEAQKLKDSNEDLQEKIKELKTEKNDLRDEKQRLKAEKESLQQQIKFLSSRPSYVTHPPIMSAPFPAQGQATTSKLMMPIFGYPGFPMWQIMPPPANVDKSQEADADTAPLA